MRNRVEEARTASLMLGMAEALGASEAGVAAQIGADGLDRMVRTCRGCTRADDCILWLASGGPVHTSAPDYCLNGEELGVLSR